MDSNAQESYVSDTVIIFPKSENFIECDGDANGICSKQRIDRLSLPTIRHLIASGFMAIKFHNDRHVRNLEKLLCAKLSETSDNTSTTDVKFESIVKRFITKNRPRTPVDPYKFSTDDLDHPIFFETCQTGRDGILHKTLVYNFRGIPKPLSQNALEYTPTERILKLSQPRRLQIVREPNLLFKRRHSFHKKMLKSMSDSAILTKPNVEKTPKRGISIRKKLNTKRKGTAKSDENKSDETTDKIKRESTTDTLKSNSDTLLSDS